MECPNQTAPNEFILSGFPCTEDLKAPLILFFSIMFALTLCGNSLIILAVITNHQLHKPMYWFLCHLSILDMAFSTVVVPKVTAGFNQQEKIISFSGCISQVFFLNFFGCTECFLYTVMAYDRFLAICKPLHYGNLMSSKACLILSLGTIMGGTLHSTLLTSLTFHLSYGENNYIDYIFCDVPSILKMACVDIHFQETVIIVAMGFLTITSFLFILTSYVYIFMAILKISSREGWHKTFSTCSAHLTVVCLYFLPVFYHYLRPASQDVMESVVCVFYTTITPLTFHLPYGDNNYSDYIFCDVPSILKMACVDIYFQETVIIIEMGLLAITFFLLILAWYTYIITTILKISSSERRQRAFSTCSAHLTVVVIYYLPLFSRYLKPASQDIMESVVCVFYTTITPLLNPIIYTLRNKEMKTALVKLWGGNPE